MSNGVVQIAVGNDGTQWGLDANGNTRRKDGSNWNHMGGGKATHIVVADANNVWCCNEHGMFFKWTGSSWEQIKEAFNVVSLAITADWRPQTTNIFGQRHKLETNGSWSDAGTLTLWVPSDGQSTRIYIVKAGDKSVGNIVKREYGLSGAALWAKVSEVAQLNKATHPNIDDIDIGDQILLPV